MYKKPEKLLVFFRSKKTDYYEKNLAFAVHSDPQGLKERLMTAQQWAQKEQPAMEIPNEWLAGFKIESVVGRNTTENKVWRIKDPRGFLLEIQSPNFAQILENCNIKKGEIEEECSWTVNSSGRWELFSKTFPEELLAEMSKTKDDVPKTTKLKIGDVINISHDINFLSNKKIEKSQEYVCVGVVYQNYASLKYQDILYDNHFIGKRGIPGFVKHMVKYRTWHYKFSDRVEYVRYTKIYSAKRFLFKSLESEETFVLLTSTHEVPLRNITMEFDTSEKELNEIFKDSLGYASHTKEETFSLSLKRKKPSIENDIPTFDGTPAFERVENDRKGNT